MPSGNTTTSSLADSLDSIIASARIVGEHEGTMTKLAQNVILENNTGTSWQEISLAKLTAQGITESTDLQNYQQLSDSLLTITPGMDGIAILITDKVRRTISKKTLAQTGELGMNAMIRKMDLAGLAMLDGATTSLGGAGTTMTSGLISTAVSRISSNATEPFFAPFRAVLQGYQVKDIEDELKAGIGTYNIPEGLTARVFTEGFRGMVGGAQVYVDDNLTSLIDSSDDVKGGVFAEKALIFVKAEMPRRETERKPNIGGGADLLYIYQDSGWGERGGGVGLYEIYTDATTPTS